MKIRNWAARLLTAVLAAGILLGLSGCGQETKHFTAEKLNVWIWDESQLATWQALADSWTEGTGITVAFTVKDRETYWADVDKGVLPDILWVDSDHFQTYAAAGTFLQLDSLLEGSRAVKLENYYPQVVENLQTGGHTYALPKDSAVTALWYNQAIFDSMSLSYPDDTWTWEDLYTAAQKLTNRHTGKYGIAIAADDTGDGWYNLVYAYGGAILKTDESGNTVSGWGDTETGEAMELLARLIADCMPSQPTLAQLAAEDLFAEGHVAMLLQNSQEALELIRRTGASNWACTVLPYCDRDGSGDCGEGERVSVMEGSGWAISGKSQDSAAAFDLLETFCGETGQKALAEANVAQPAYKAAVDDWAAELEGWDFTPYHTTLAQSELVALPVQWSGESWQDYALSTTLYTAWNDPGRMAAMLAQQEVYTASDLEGRQQSTAEPDDDSNEEG